MSTQIDSLSIRIESNSKSATTAIDGLIASLGRLKTAANLGGADKSIKKIGDAVSKGMSGASKATNKGTDSLNKFSKASDKVTQSTGKLQSALGGAASGLLQFAGNAFGIHSVGQALTSSLNAAKEWEGISARFAEGFGDQADEAYAHVQKLSDALYINDQVFMQYSSNFATLARGFGVTESAIKDMSIGLTELAYDIYAKNNDFYTFEEALLAVRSAIVGEVEPIRLAGISITEATLKEVAASNGLTKSVENMTEAEKALLRYKAMVDQAYASGTVGTYIKELGTVEGSSRALAQQLKGLAQAIGALVMPAIAAVLPYLQALIDLATRAINAIASLFGLRIKVPTWGGGLSTASKSAEGVTNTLNTATKAANATDSSLTNAAKAAKKLKDYMMGFDELNVIRPEDESSGGGGGGGVGGGGIELEVGSLWTDEMIAAANLKSKEIADKIVAFLQPIQDAIDRINFEPLISSAKRLWEAVKPFAATIGQGLYWFLLNVLIPLAGYTIENIIPAFLNGLAATLEWVTPQLQQFGGWVEANKEHILTVAGYVAAFFLSFKLVNFVQTAISAIGPLTGVVDGLKNVVGFLLPRIQSLIVLFTSSGGGLAGAGAVVKTVFSSLISTVFSPLTLVIIAVAAVIMVLVANWDKVVATFKNFIDNIDLAGKFEAIKTALAPLMEKLAGLKDLFTVIGTFVLAVLQPAIAVLAGVFNGVLSAIAPLIDAVGGLIDILAGFGTFLVGIFTGDVAKAGEGVQTMIDGVVALFSGLWEACVGFVTGFVDGVISWFVSLGETLGIGEWFASAMAWFTNLPATISGFFTDAWTFIQGIFSEGIIGEYFSAVLGWVTAPFKTIGALFKGDFDGAYAEMKAPFAATSEFFVGVFDSVSGAFATVDQFFSDTFGDAWTSIKEKFADFIIGQYFQSIWDTVAGIFSVVKSVLSGNFSDAWEAIKGVFSSWGDFFSGLWTTISTTFTDLGTTIGDAVGGAVKAGVNGVLQWVEDTVNGAIGAINDIIATINSWTGKVGITIGEIGTFTIPKLASGGFVDQGQLFIAREAGAEMVGSMGGHTAVANNDQIVEGISSGVYAAVRAAMSENSGDKNITVEVYLDGKRVTDSVEKRQRERGATIMTGGVNFGY